VGAREVDQDGHRPTSPTLCHGCCQMRTFQTAGLCFSSSRRCAERTAGVPTSARNGDKLRPECVERRQLGGPGFNRIGDLADVGDDES
jgi:hypothetical protein